MDEVEPIHQEIEDQKEKLISRISLWVSIILTTIVVIWYYNENPPDSPAVVKMRVFFKENNRDVMKFIDLPRKEMIAFAYKKIGPEKVVYASDHPYILQQDSLMATCDFFDKYNFSSTDQEWILSKSFSRIFASA